MGVSGNVYENFFNLDMCRKRIIQYFFLANYYYIVPYPFIYCANVHEQIYIYIRTKLRSIVLASFLKSKTKFVPCSAIKKSKDKKNYPPPPQLN